MSTFSQVSYMNEWMVCRHPKMCHSIDIVEHYRLNRIELSHRQVAAALSLPFSCCCCWWWNWCVLDSTLMQTLNNHHWDREGKGERRKTFTQSNSGSPKKCFKSNQSLVQVCPNTLKWSISKMSIVFIDTFSNQFQYFFYYVVELIDTFNLLQVYRHTKL